MRVVQGCRGAEATPHSSAHFIPLEPPIPPFSINSGDRHTESFWIFFLTARREDLLLLHLEHTSLRIFSYKMDRIKEVRLPLSLLPAHAPAHSNICERWLCVMHVRPSVCMTSKRIRCPKNSLSMSQNFDS